MTEHALTEHALTEHEPTDRVGVAESTEVHSFGKHRMLYRRLLVVAIVAWMVPDPCRHVAVGQTLRDGIVGPGLAEKIGLYRAWLTHVDADRSRERVSAMTLNVCRREDRRFVVFAVSYGQRKAYFSERHSGPFGAPLGREGARQRAEDLIERQKALGQQPTLEELSVPDVTLYLQTTQGVLHAIDGEVGRTRWAVQVGDVDRPCEPAAASDDYVAMISGSQLNLIDAIDGKILWQRPLDGVPTAGPAISAQWVFVPTLRGTIEAFSLSEPDAPIRMYSSSGRATTRLTASPQTVSWPTTRDFLYVSPADKLEAKFRLQTRQTIVAPSTRQPPGTLFAASLGGIVYAVSEQNGNILWRHSTGHSISQSPVPIEESLYVVTDDVGMYSLSTKTGAQQWWVGGVRKFLACSEAHVYCMADQGEIWVLDAKTGTRQGAMFAIGLDLSLVNWQTDRIYVGNSAGVIQCLHEPQWEWPLLHVPEEEVTAKGDKPPESSRPDALPNTQAAQPAGSVPDAGALDGLGDDFGPATSGETKDGSATEEVDPFGFGDGNGLFE